MRTDLERLRSTKGTSIMEVLVALFLTGIITAAIFQIYINQHKNWSIQGDVTEMQQNARAAIDELTRQIRMAGYQLALGVPCIEAYNTDPDTIVINLSDDGCNVTLSAPMPTPSSELLCDGKDVSCFYDGQIPYIYDTEAGEGEYFEISQVQTGSSHIQHNDWPLNRIYDADAIILSLTRYKFYIDYSDSAHPNLMLQVSDGTPQVYAENIYDLHFKYRLNNGLTVDVPPIADEIREVMIVIYARTTEPDPDNEYDPYRKRAYISRVNLRNLDI